MREKIQLNEAQLRDRLLILAAEHGPEVLEASADDLEQLALSQSAYYSLDGKSTDQLLQVAARTIHYGLLASLARRADELELDRTELRSQVTYNELEVVPLEVLRRNSRRPQYAMGQRVYMPTSGSSEEGDEEIMVVGCMEVFIVSIEYGFDYVQYQIGQLQPEGKLVDILGEWVDEAELYVDADAAQAAVMPDEPSPLPKMRPQLSLVRD